MFIYLWTGIIMQKVNSSGRESGLVRSTTGAGSGTTSRKRVVSTSSTTSTASRKSSTIRGSYRRRGRGSRAGVRTSVPISKSTSNKSTFGRLTGGFRRFIDSRKTRVTESSSSTSAPYRLQFGTDYIPVYRISAYGNRLLTYVRLHPTGLIFSSRPSIPLRSSSSVSSTTTPTRITRSAGPSTKPLLTRTSSVREDFISWDQLIGVTCRKRELKITYRNAAQQQNIPVDSGFKPSSESSILNLKFLLLADLKSFLTAGLLYGYFSNEKIAEAVLGQQGGGDVEMGNVSGKVQSSQGGESKNKTKKKGLFRFVRHIRTALSSKRNRNSHTINSSESAAPEEPTAISTLATSSTRPSTPPNPYINWMNLNRKALNNRATISSPA